MAVSIYTAGSSGFVAFVSALPIWVLSRHVRHPHLACVLLVVGFLHHQIHKLSLSSLFLNHDCADYH